MRAGVFGAVGVRDQEKMRECDTNEGIAEDRAWSPGGPRRAASYQDARYGDGRSHPHGFRLASRRAHVRAPALNGPRLFRSRLSRLGCASAKERRLNFLTKRAVSLTHTHHSVEVHRSAGAHHFAEAHCFPAARRSADVRRPADARLPTADRPASEDQGCRGAPTRRAHRLSGARSRGGRCTAAR